MDKEFRRQVKESVANPQVRKALQHATHSACLGHAASIESIDWQGLRRELRAMKEAAIRDLPDLVVEFKDEAEKSGAVIFEAADAAAARGYAAELARSHAVKLAVKSKSMLTEEIHLNSHLEASGIEVVETDLGEWIIQLAGERPSHFVGPAIHKTKEEIAELFSRKLGVEVPPDPPTMTRLARRELRRRFVEADLGVSGANMGLAETGSIVLVTNEGNGRLVTTLPPVHLAFVGYEKIIPGLTDAALVLKLLSRSSGGKKMTSYVSYITGPSRTMDIEKTLVWGVHGPEQVHIVLVDNGRMRMRDDADFREALYCIKCGACLNACPVFQIVGGHVFGRVYHGGIGAILTAFQEGMEQSRDLASLCIGCGRCTEVCPAMINTPAMIQVLKERLAKGHDLPWSRSLLYRRLLPDRKRFRTALKAADILPAFARPVPSEGTWPRPASVPFHSSRPAESGEPQEATVAFYPGCMMDIVQPEMGHAVVGALNGRAVRVEYPQEETCCGGPAIFSGDTESGKAMARRNLAVLEGVQADAIVTACPSCALVLKREYRRLFSDEPDWLRRAEALAERVNDFASYMAGIDSHGANGLMKNGQPGEARLAPTGQAAAVPKTLKVTYHDSCHLKRALGVSQEPRDLISRAGHELVEMEEADRCCGYGGTYSMDHPSISAALLNRKLDDIEASGAQVVACDCPGCLLHLATGLKRRGSGIRAVHTAELLT